MKTSKRILAALLAALTLFFPDCVRQPSGPDNHTCADHAAADAAGSTCTGQQFQHRRGRT